MTREATNAEKAVFGAGVLIDEETDLPIEQGIGSATDRERTAARDARMAHSAEFERLQEAEKSLAAELADAKAELTAAHEQIELLVKRAEDAEARAILKPSDGSGMH